MSARGLLLALDYPPAAGGIARLLEGWTENDAPIEWRVITTTPGPTAPRVIRASPRAMPVLAIRISREWLRGADQRVVVAGHVYLSGIAVAAAQASGARSAALAYGLELLPRNLRHRAALAPLRTVDTVVAISEHTAKLTHRLGAKSVFIIHPGLRPSWMPTTPARRQHAEGLRLVTLSRLAEGYKNIELLLRLCSVLHPIGVVESLTVIGGGPRLESLRAKAESVGVGHAVRFLGHIPDDQVRKHLATSHVGLFPSRNSVAEGGFEGFGLVAGEMAACGLPVLAGAAAGARDAVHQPWGHLLDPDDLWSWVEAVQRLYDDESHRLAMGEAALSWAKALKPEDSIGEFSRVLLGKSAANRRAGKK